MPRIDRRAFLGSTLGAVGALTARAAIAQSAHDSLSEDISLFDGPHQAPNTLFLTWDRDPTTSVTIQWVAPPSKVVPQIHYKPALGAILRTAKVTTRTFPLTELLIYRCELTELESDGEYEFQIDGRSPLYRFRTMPAKSTNAIQFVSGGDSGANAHALRTNALAAAQDPRFVLFGGDLAYENGVAPEVFIKFLQNYHATMWDSAGRLIPMIACIGNHEVGNIYNASRELGPFFFSVFGGLFAERSFGVFDIGDYLSLVLLDSGHVAPVAGEQTDWLERTLKERVDRPHLIAVNHVPAYPSNRTPYASHGEAGTGDDQRTHWCPLFERFKVDLVLEHHDHAFKRTHPLTNGHFDRYGVIYLGDGSWGKLQPQFNQIERPYLASFDAAYHLSVHRLEGDRRFHVALAENGRVADVLMTESKRPSRR